MEGCVRVSITGNAFIMINRVISFSIENKLIIGLFTLALIVVGIWSISRVPLDAVPDITNNQVQVITQAPNLGTEDIEQFVTYPVEVAMANLPGVTEIRSVSRFGLSVVTIVFDDDIGTYLPRQLVSEKLTEVKEQIPNGFGVPTMGPISTGLGEIYQYTLEVDSAYAGQYSAMDLRTMQDWIVRRQMAMVPGVVEVNAFGGSVKQYEVAVNPDELKAIGITITEVFSALEVNNQNTGGAYIEKDHQANFIRGEGLARSIEDIENIVVKNVNGIPITVKNVASVSFGEAVRYGAFTKDGKGEAVGGMILMLKGANSNDVVSAVKDRVTDIQKSLPEGVRIIPFLDRSALIAKTTGTVSQNLLEGALIVIFVLVFLLGNWRGGLIVASTIPLSLLFAFILMNVFDVWANLMSLGAIDFGIIVDGAVIIVETTVFLLYDKVLSKKPINGDVRNSVAKEASSKMMNAAFFGQLIILIVFIPILALQGVEGKMFQPMAMTFMFAMVGVMVLCLTYVPMMSALFIRMGKSDKLSPGDRLVKLIERGYVKALAVVLRRGKIVIVSAVVMLGLAVFTFTRMGGEFIPQLDEGDLAFHAILKPGSSLTETIETTTEIEKIVKTNFPEVVRIVSRIGVADVPTDPMPMDIADVFVILKPQDQWTSAENKEELVELIKEKVSAVPGVNFEFTQPIEMRFNELLTGVREDIAVKLFGDDLDILASKAEEMGSIISTVQGVGDMKVEATSGLPQMTVIYDRSKLAQYGLTVSELNTVVQSAFAGGNAGVIFEGEKRFDLVVRLDLLHRKNIDDLRNLYIYLPSGAQIPLKEVADISYLSGPMQISRDNTNRRTYVGINVRGRDVKSLVEEIQQKLDSELDLPPGYYIRYGGAFENLERATDRLKVVVPIALGLIFLLIFFALKSIKQSAMIYMAIPLAAIGGVFSLWIRDMPFSISAGVGFVVLFGVAVLNGLVLISGWNELKEEGISNLNERIRLGTKRRIRPILLTALTDVLGFLPMAVSSSAGAEVQQPLATVVIGGMITATLLTLFVLPVLYRAVETRQERRNKTSVQPAIGVIILFLIGFSLPANSQTEDTLTLDQAIEIGLENHPTVDAAELSVEQQLVLKKTAFALDKTQVSYTNGQINSSALDYQWQINQAFQFPTSYFTQYKLQQEKVELAESGVTITTLELERNIRKAWWQMSYGQELVAVYSNLVEVYEDFSITADIRYGEGEINALEKTSAQTMYQQVLLLFEQAKLDLDIHQVQLTQLLCIDSALVLPTAKLEKLPYVVVDTTDLQGHPTSVFYNQQVDVATQQLKVENAAFLPDLNLGYFNQQIDGVGGFSGLQVGVGLPLFFWSQLGNSQGANVQIQIAEANYEAHLLSLTSIYLNVHQDASKYMLQLDWYEDQGLLLSDELVNYADKSYQEGSIDYIEFISSIEQSIEIRLDYLNILTKYNLAITDLEYLIGNYNN